MNNEMMDIEDFDAEMEALAIHIMKKAKGTDVKLEEKIKAFEAIQPYHAAREKYKGKTASGGSNGKPTFGKFKSNVTSPSKEQ